MNRMFKETANLITFFFYTLNLVSDPSANISVTVRLLIHTSFASLIGFNLDISVSGDVLYDLILLVWLFPKPNIPAELWNQNIHFNHLK